MWSTSSHAEGTTATSSKRGGPPPPLVAAWAARQRTAPGAFAANRPLKGAPRGCRERIRGVRAKTPRTPRIRYEASISPTASSAARDPPYTPHAMALLVATYSWKK